MEAIPLSDVMLATIVCSLMGLTMFTVFSPGMIFAPLGELVRTSIPAILQKPIATCPICMSFWYGLIYNVGFLHTDVQVSVAGSILSIGLTSWLVGFTQTDDDVEED